MSDPKNTETFGWPNHFSKACRQTSACGLATAGFTLIELLVVMAVIGVLAGLLFPAVQSIRETARHTDCINRVRQIGLSIKSYEAAHKRIPPSRAADGYLTWCVLLMPYQEDHNLYDQLDIKAPYSMQPPAVTTLPAELYFCPSRRSSGEISLSETGGEPVGAVGDYAGNAGSNKYFDPSGIGTPYTGEWSLFHQEVDGVFNSGYAIENPIDPLTLKLRRAPTGRYRIKDISDGISHTIFIGEKSVSKDHRGEPGGWADGCIYNGNEPGTFMRLGGIGLMLEEHNDIPAPGPGAVPTFGSEHKSVVNFLFGDGSVRAISTSISGDELRRLCSRNDGEIPPKLD